MTQIRERECPNCRKLEAALQRLQKQVQQLQAQLQEAQERIQQLEAQVRRGRRQAAPFSKDEPKADPQPPGRRPGQGRFTRREPPPEEEIQRTITVPLARCPQCGGELKKRTPHEQIQVDLPQVRPEVIRFRTESGYCPRCRRRVRSRHPD